MAWGKPYERRVWRGEKMDNRTIAALLEAEKRYGKRVALWQGSYQTPTSYSGTSHTGGGSVDVYDTSGSLDDNKRLVRKMRDVGWAAWLRTPAQGNWVYHVHAQLIGHQTASDSAKWQALQYRAPGGPYDGLSASHQDWMMYRPSPVPVFDYAAWKKALTLRDRLADIRKQMAALADRKQRLQRELVDLLD